MLFKTKTKTTNKHKKKKHWFEISSRILYIIIHSQQRIIQHRQARAGQGFDIKFA